MSSTNFDIDRFNLKELNEVKSKNSIRLKSQIGLQIWKLGWWCGH